MKILVCGGAGYLGSHACVALLERGHQVVVYDNLSSGSAQAVARAGELGGGRATLVVGDIRDRATLRSALHGVDAVVHFAALKVAGESRRAPLAYFDNNVAGTLALLQAMQDAGVTRLVFSSSAAVYGEAARMPLDESAPLRPATPYGRSKLMMEQVIADVCAAQTDFAAVALRYFNPLGAHPSGRIGEVADVASDNLMPRLVEVAAGRRPHLPVYGDDYPTPDGSGVRDFIHVMDLANAHVRAVERLTPGFAALNLGTGAGHSVLQLVRAFEQASGRAVPYRTQARRDGDVAACWADPARAQAALGWRADHGLERMCEDAWRWHSRHPQGYAGHA